MDAMRNIEGWEERLIRATERLIIEK